MDNKVRLCNPLGATHPALPLRRPRLGLSRTASRHFVFSANPGTSISAADSADGVHRRDYLADKWRSGGITRYNQDKLDVALHVRIGLSAGEPIEEGRDIFGAAVQLAADICDLADSDQILAAQVVHDLCPPDEQRFHEVGQMNLKGVPAPVTLYEVSWDRISPA